MAHADHHNGRPSVVPASRALIAAIVVGALLSGAGLFFAVRTDGGLAEQERQDEIAGCKSLYFADLQAASTELLAALGSAVTTDELVFAEATTLVPVKVEAVELAGDEYTFRVAQSIDDTATFLEECQEKR